MRAARSPSCTQRRSTPKFSTLTRPCSVSTLTLMKPRDLIRQLREAAIGAELEFVTLRNTGGHEVFSLDGLRIPVPNHREIAEGTARSIKQQAAAKLGEEWWR